MLRKLLVGIALGALTAAPVIAAEGESKEPEPSETKAVSHMGWGFRVGYLKGDEAAHQPIGKIYDELSQPPDLKDSMTFGGLFYNDAMKHLRVEARVSLAPGKIEHVCPNVDVTSPTPEVRSCRYQEEDVSVKVLYWDIVFVPHFQLGDGRFHLGIPFGVGWANARSSGDLAPASEIVSRGGDVTFTADAGMTYFLGARPWMDIGHGRSVFFELRTLRFHRLVNMYARTLKTVEATFGMTFPIGGKKKAAKKEAPPAEAPPAEAPPAEAPEKP